MTTIRTVVKKLLKQKGSFKASEIVKATKYSRAYVHRVLKELQAEGIITLIGKADRAHYIPATTTAIEYARAAELRYHRILKNEHVAEDRILDEIKQSTGIYRDLPEHIARILDYGFTEMLNNAIEHSRSQFIRVTMARTKNIVRFSVIDRGIGIYRNIREQQHLASDLEALQQLLKGKLTTAPASHSGEGIFFTSRVADLLIIKSRPKQLIFDNRRNDVFIKDTRLRVGTTVEFEIGLSAQRSLEEVFRRYTTDSFEFGTTDITIKLFQEGNAYVSRSQARRILAGIEKFRTIILDFRGVETIGQAFADEIFRVWKQHHPEISIEYRNANENVLFMIKHVSEQTKDNL